MFCRKFQKADINMYICMAETSQVFLSNKDIFLAPFHIFIYIIEISF